MKPHFKPIPATESNLFRVESQENHKEFDYPWHYHPEYELSYILKSHGVRYVGNSVDNYFDNDLVMVGANLPHCWINTPGQQYPVKAIVIYIKEEFLNITWMQSCEFESIARLLELSKKGIRFDERLAVSLKDRFLNLLKLPPFEKFVSLLKILQELSQTSDYECLCNQGFNYDLNFTINKRINKVYQFVQENYRRKITLAQVAAQVNMNEAYFSRFFSKTMRKSFFEFLNEYRINRVCKLLIETNDPIAEICYASGFESIPFFYRQFKKFKNSQPKSYRLNYHKASILLS